MAQARELKRRIRSVDNTRKITRTMEMVATSKLKKATDRVYAARPYGEALDEIVRSLYAPHLREKFPLLRQPTETKRVAILLLTANRGLAGGFNTNLVREARERLAEFRAAGIETELHVVGKKGISYFRFRGEDMVTQRNDIPDVPSQEDASSLVGTLSERFERGELDRVIVVGSAFRSAMSTPVSSRQLLPIVPGEAGVAADAYLLTPGLGEVLKRLLPLYLRNTVFRALVENAAAEQGARRTAMKSATDNAGDMLDDLNRTYNRARQAQITQEIAEIVGGAAALE
jgi:F-type H+-transporting ATPase subunit gamma